MGFSEGALGILRRGASDSQKGRLGFSERALGFSEGALGFSEGAPEILGRGATTKIARSVRNTPAPEDSMTHVQLFFTWGPSPPRSSKFTFEIRVWWYRKGALGRNEWCVWAPRRVRLPHSKTDIATFAGLIEKPILQLFESMFSSGVLKGDRYVSQKNHNLQTTQYRKTTK